MDNTAKINEMLYEKVFKENLMIALQERKLSYNEAKAMLSLKCPLDELYQEWMRTDISYMDMLSDIVDNRMQKAVVQQQKSEKER